MVVVVDMVVTVIAVVVEEWPCNSAALLTPQTPKASLG